MLVDRALDGVSLGRAALHARSGRTVPRSAAILRVFFVSTFLGSFLPSVGGDAVRAYGIARLDIRGGDAVASVFMDRMLGVASLSDGAGGLTLARELAGNWVILASLAVGGAACAW